MATIGYCRVSTAEQGTALQEDALLAQGCERVFSDIASGALTQRPQLDAALAYLRAGDVLVVWKLDRLGRSLKHLIGLVGDLDERGIAFKSVSENIDTTSASGRLLFNVMGSLAEFERDLIAERTRAGLVAARARGRHGGRPPKLSPQKVALARRLYDEGESPGTIADTLGVSRATIYRSLRAVSASTGPDAGVTDE